MSEKKKVPYRLRNWSAYNKALKQRGSLTIWIADDVAESWLADEIPNQRGRQKTYSDTAIECALTLQAVYKLALRQTQGFVTSIMGLMGLQLPVPDYTTLSRRRNGMEIKLPRRKKGAGLHIVIDATGFKVYGHGEWHMRKHYTNKDGSERKKPRLWRKIHLAIDVATQEVMAVVTTESNTHDKTMLPDLLDQINEPIFKVGGDGGYDYVSCYEAIEGEKAKAIIPPRSNAIINEGWEALEQRNEAIRRIEEVGRKQWKIEGDYHQRSLAETAIFRLKIIFGANLRSRILENQSAEMLLRCKILNQMTYLGMPDSYPVPLAS